MQLTLDYNRPPAAGEFSNERLVAMAQAGSVGARTTLMEQNIGLCYQAIQEVLPSENAEEFMSLAVIGLENAIDRFDGSKGFLFISYAIWYIKAKLREEIAEFEVIRRPYNRMDDRRAIKRRLDAGELEAEIRGDIGDRRVDNALKEDRAISYDHDPDAEYSEGGGASWDRASDPALSVTQEHGGLHYRGVDDLLACLDDRDRAVLKLYYLEDLTLDAIGAQFDLTRERVRQLRNQALERVRVTAKRTQNLKRRDLHWLIKDKSWSETQLNAARYKKPHPSKRETGLFR